ncbi:MAG: HDOD domain-containing protein [Myxococcota bacterium]
MIGRFRTWLGRRRARAAAAPIRAAAATGSANDWAALVWLRLGELRAEAAKSRRGRKDDLPLLDALVALLAQNKLVLPPPPDAAELVAAAADLAAPPARRVTLARRESELSRALITLANSSSYDTEVPCAGVEQAVLRVGPGGFRSAVLAIALRDVVPLPSTDPLRARAEALWTHARRTATLARRLAPAFQADAEDCFAAALMHDFGQLCTLHALAAIARSDGGTPKPSAALIERLRALHEPLGALAARRWGLGETVAVAVARHHRESVPQGILPVADTVFLADAADRAAERQVPFDLEDVVCGHDLAASIEMAADALSEPWWEG